MEWTNKEVFPQKKPETVKRHLSKACICHFEYSQQLPVSYDTNSSSSRNINRSPLCLRLEFQLTNLSIFFRPRPLSHTTHSNTINTTPSTWLKSKSGSSFGNVSNSDHAYLNTCRAICHCLKFRKACLLSER